MAQNITSTNDTRMCKRVIYEHTRTVQSVFLVPIDAKERELEFEFNDGDTELRYRVGAKGPGISMPRVSLEDDDEEYRPHNKWCETEKVNQDDAKLDDKTFTAQVGKDLAEVEKKSKATPMVGEKRVRNESTL